MAITSRCRRDGLWPPGVRVPHHPPLLRRKMSQGDICRAIGMDRSYMSAIEGGKVNVTLGVLEKLAKALDVSVDGFLK